MNDPVLATTISSMRSETLKALWVRRRTQHEALTSSGALKPPSEDRKLATDDAWLLLHLSQLASRSGRASLAVEYAKAGLNAFQKSPHNYPWKSWVFHFSQSEALLQLGHFSDAYESARRRLTDFLSSSDLEPIAWFCWQLCRLCSDCGFPGAAIDYGRTAVTIFGQLNRCDMEKIALASLSTAMVIAGHLAEAEELIARSDAVPGMPGTGWVSEIAHAHAWVLAVRGDMSAACENLHGATCAAAFRGDVAGETLLLHARARFGDPRPVLERLTSLADQSEDAIVRARADHARALAGTDPEPLAQCGVTFEALGALLLATESLALAASQWRHHGSHEHASGAEARAAALMDRCGRPTLPMVETRLPTTTLSPAERTVATLAAAGLPNKDIAQRLSLSVRTVETHLQHVYRKLGITSRRQLTRFRLISDSIDPSAGSTVSSVLRHPTSLRSRWPEKRSPS